MWERPHRWCEQPSRCDSVYCKLLEIGMELLNMQCGVVGNISRSSEVIKKCSGSNQDLSDAAPPSCAVANLENLIDATMLHWLGDYVPDCDAEDVLHDYVGEGP